MLFSLHLIIKFQHLPISQTSQSKYSNSGTAPADINSINASLATKSLLERVDATKNRSISAMVFVNDNWQLQAIYAPHVSLTDNKAVNHVIGSLYDDTTMLPSLGKVPPSAMGFATYTTKFSQVSASDRYGKLLTETELAGTTLEGKGLTDLVVKSVPLFFLWPMKSPLMVGSITDPGTLHDFGALCVSFEKWIQGINACRKSKDDMSQIFDNIEGKEEEFVSPNYTPAYYPSHAPALSITIVDRSTGSAGDYEAVAEIMNIKPAAATATPAPAAASVTYVMKDDKDAKAQQAEVLVTYEAMFMKGTVDWETNKVSNLSKATFTDAFKSAMATKNIEDRAAKLKSMITELVDPAEQDALTRDLMNESPFL